MNRLSASILVLLGSASYGLLSSITKLAYKQGFTTADVVGSQAFFGFVCFWLISLPHWRQLFALPFTTIAALLASGAISGLTGVFYYLSLQTLTASYAVILLFQFTWMGMLFDWVYRNRRPQPRHWLALVLILGGTFLAAGYHTFTSGAALPLTGIALGLLAAVSYTLFINFSGHVALQVPTIMRNTWMITGTLLLTFSVFPPRFLLDTAVLSNLWLWSSILGMFGVLIPFYLFAKGVPHIGTGLAAILGSVELPVVIIVSSYLLMEQTSLIQWLGIATIFCGVVLSVGKEPEATLNKEAA